MYRRKCQECGKQMEFKLGAQIKPFCSKHCSDIHREKMYNHPDNGPVMPPLKVESITDEGYISLVKAIVARASHDVTHFKPGTQIRAQAELFFRSDHFSNLTGLDGEAVLRDLGKGKKKEKKSIPKKQARKVICLDTGAVFESISEAGRAYKCSPHGIRDVCAKRRKTYRGMRWEYVEDGAV